MAATFADLGFRDIAGRLLVVECPLLERLDKAGIVVPGGADAVLAYAYVDHAQGLSLFALATASLEGGVVFHGASFPVAQNRSAVLRSGSIPPESRVLFPDDAGALEERYSEQIERVEKACAPSEGVLAARGVERIDAFRSPECPGDVLAVLASEGLPSEGVWFRLEGIAGEDALAGVLLNEPDGAYPVHEGDLMALVLTESDDGSATLVTVPDLLISRRARSCGARLRCGARVGGHESSVDPASRGLSFGALLGVGE